MVEAVEAWKYDSGEQIWSPAVTFTNGNIAVATASVNNTGRFLILSPDGELVWEHEIGTAGAVRTPIVYDPQHDRVLVSTLGGHVLAFNNGNGPAWDNNLSFPAASMALHDTQLYVLTIYGEVHVINTDNGSDAWAVGSITNDSVFSRVAIDPTGRAYFGDSGGAFFCVTEAGTEWSTQSAGGIEGRPIIAPGGAVYYGSADGFVTAVNPDGSPLWSTEVGGQLASDMSRDPVSGDLFVLSGLESMSRLDGESGAELWTVPIDDWVQGTGIAADAAGTLYVASALGYVRAVDPEAGDVSWSPRPEARHTEVSGRSRPRGQRVYRSRA